MKPALEKIPLLTPESWSMNLLKDLKKVVLRL